MRIQAYTMHCTLHTALQNVQVLRYNVSRAYIEHLDYLDEVPGDSHSFDSGGLGTNRFATVSLLNL
jgi:hypothetical protein